MVVGEVGAGEGHGQTVQNLISWRLCGNEALP